MMKDKDSDADTVKRRLIALSEDPQQQEANWRRSARKLLRLLLIVAQQFQRNELSLRSGALTYTVMLSLIPMLAMSTAIVKGMGGGDELRKAAYTYLEGLESTAASLPTTLSEESTATSEGHEPLTGYLREAVDTIFAYVDQTNFAALGTFGTLGILLTIVLVFSHIESAMNAIWQVKEGRSLLRKTADYLALLLLLPVTAAIAITAGAVMTSPELLARVSSLLPVNWLHTFLFQALPVICIVLAFWLMYVFFPNTSVRAWPAFIGACLAGIIWFLIQLVYLSLQVGVAKYNAIYGSFATLPLFLVWMYLGWVFILAGAQVAFALQNLEHFQLQQPITTLSERLAAAFDLIAVTQEGFLRQQPLRRQQLQQLCPDYSPALVEQTLNRLLQAGILHLSQNSDQVLPGGPWEEVMAQRVVTALFGDQTPDSLGGRQSKEICLAAINSARAMAREKAEAPSG